MKNVSMILKQARLSLIKYIAFILLLAISSLANSNLMINTGIDSLVGALPGQAVAVQKRLLIENSLAPLNEDQRQWIERNLTAERFESYLNQYLTQQLGNAKLKQIETNFSDPIAKRVKLLERQASSPTRQSAILSYKEKLQDQATDQERLTLIKSLVKLTGAYRLPNEMDLGLQSLLAETFDPRDLTSPWQVTEDDIVTYYLYTLRSINTADLTLYLNIYRQPLQRDFIVILERAIKAFFSNASANIAELKTESPETISN